MPENDSTFLFVSLSCSSPTSRLYLGRELREWENRASQTSLCLAASPPPQISKERVAGWARPRPTGNTLFTLFLGGEGKRKKTHILIGMGQRTCEQASCSTGEKSGRTQVRLRGLSR